MSKDPRIVIAGAGFGGLWALKTLFRCMPSCAPVTLIDRNNYHTFLPLLYQVASAELDPEEIAYPVRGFLRRYSGVRFVMGNLSSVDPAARKIKVDEKELEYDYLIMAIGSVTNYYGVPGAQLNTYPLKTMEHAITLRNQILSCFEKAAEEKDEKIRLRMLTFVIVGGGATGVEFAGSLSELIHGSLMRDYPALDRKEIRIMILEREGTLLAGFPERLRSYALKRLTRMRVEVRLKTSVMEARPGSVYLENNVVVPSETVVWMAGVGGEPVSARWGFSAGQAGRLNVLPTLQVPNHPEVYIVGDLSLARQDEGKPFPMIAPVAIQQGIWAARNITRQISGEEPLPFKYHDKGSMVTIGRNAAAVYFRGRSFTGFPAWLLWLATHLWYLIGFPNRFFVLAHWALDYFFYERVVRLVLP